MKKNKYGSCNLKIIARPFVWTVVSANVVDYHLTFTIIVMFWGLAFPQSQKATHPFSRFTLCIKGPFILSVMADMQNRISTTPCFCSSSVGRGGETTV
jgi:hypothetical protein